MSLTVALDRVDFLPANRVTDNAAILTLKSLVFEPLCRWNDGRIEPALFASWSCDEAARRWRFRLRRDAMFHDGVPCTARHIVEYIDGILVSRDMFGMPWSYARYFEGARFTAVGQDVLDVEAATSFADMPEVFAEFFICRADASGRPLLGTGPYRVAALEPGHEAVLVPVGGGGAITAVAIVSAEARLAAVREGSACTGRVGQIDVACALEQMHAFPDFGPDLAWARNTSTLSVMAYLDASNGVFRDPSLRLAANLAMDKDRFVREVFGGLAQPAATVVSPFHFGHAASGCAPLPYAPDAAKRLLDASGVSGELLLRTPDHMPERAPGIAIAIAAALDSVGFRTQMEMQHDRPQYAREVGRKQMGDVALFDSSPHSTFRVLDDKISSVSQGVWWQGYHDTEVERLIAQARHTVSAPDRAAVYGKCLARLNLMPPWLYLVHPVLVCAWRHGRGSFSLDHRGILRIGKIPA